MKICSYCGTPNDDNSTHCKSCSATEFKYQCENCGTIFEDGFCPKCGVKAGQKAKTCPKCGEKYFSAACPSCGYRPDAGNQAKTESTVIIRETPVPAPKKKGCLGSALTVFLWIVFLPIMGIIAIWKSEKLTKTVKIVLTAVIAVIMIIAGVSGSGSSDEPEPTNTGESQSAGKETQNESKAPKASSTAAETLPVKDIYNVGDSAMADSLKITYVASGNYEEDNQFMQPAAGNHFVFLRLAAENTDKKSDHGITVYEFSAFADGYAVEKHYTDEDISATLSPGRFTVGTVCFEVPDSAKEIEVEYEINMFTGEKIKFAFEGDKDSGYTPEKQSAPHADAHKVGDIVENKKFRITYLSCSEYVSTNQFVQPEDGYRYVSCELEFENLSDADMSVDFLNFRGYADGAACDITTVRDDDLNAKISAGRKAKGTVTFEVPKDAGIIEIEYRNNLFLSDAVIFDAKP